MPFNAFIVRPFGVKEVVSSGEPVARLLKLHMLGAHDADAKTTHPAAALLPSKAVAMGDGSHKVRIDFDEVHRLLIHPALEQLHIQGETTSAVVVAGNIREDMFNRLVTADLVIADVSINNPNVYYELGVRQAFRDKYTFVIRADLSQYPFDLQTDRYFQYDLIDLIQRPQAAATRLAEALRATISSTDADSPIFKLLPKLEAENRSRFIAVPDDFREEVQRARHYGWREHLGLLAVECEGYLWEVEGLRLVGRAQFESNFIEGAKLTWEQIVGRYPDDLEANTCLSTIYQRLSDFTRSEQALARASRVRPLPASRLSQLLALKGRNLKEEWIAQWHDMTELKQKQRRALTSPLLQLAYDAYLEAFKADLNNAYAGLNALTLQVIQVELARQYMVEWRSVQRRYHDAKRELELREARIRQLVSGLEVAMESERDRLTRQGVIDPWFCQLEASVLCIVSDQPRHVAQLFETAKHYAPLNAEESTRRALEVYIDLGIGGRDHDPNSRVGCIGRNVKAACDVLSKYAKPAKAPNKRRRILMFVGLRVDYQAVSRTADAAGAAAVPARLGFPASRVEAATASIREAIRKEIELGDEIAFGMAAGANGGDLLFHEICREKEIRIPTRMYLALPKARYVGLYVAPAGKEWVERFSQCYWHLRHAPRPARAMPSSAVIEVPRFEEAEFAPERAEAPVEAEAPAPNSRLADEDKTPSIPFFTDTIELPRWLQGRPYYNVGRRNNLWMLQHALTSALELGDGTEVTLLALWNKDGGKNGLGGIGDVIKHAAMQGVKIHVIEVPQEPAADQAAGAPPDRPSAPATVADIEAARQRGR